MPVKETVILSDAHDVATQMRMLRKRMFQMENNKNPTLPVYDSTNFPQESVQGQVALDKTLKSGWAYTDGEWWKLGGGIEEIISLYGKSISVSDGTGPTVEIDNWPWVSQSLNAIDTSFILGVQNWSDISAAFVAPDSHGLSHGGFGQIELYAADPTNGGSPDPPWLVTISGNFGWVVADPTIFTTLPALGGPWGLYPLEPGIGGPQPSYQYPAIVGSGVCYQLSSGNVYPFSLVIQDLNTRKVMRMLMPGTPGTLVDYQTPFTFDVGDWVSGYWLTTVTGRWTG